MFPPTEPPRVIRGDPRRVCQVLMNLLANAIEFTEKGKVWVEVFLGGDPIEPAVVFRITDT
jgi:signal transduction histidine kinase